MLCNETNLLTKATEVEDAIRFIENKNKDSLIANRTNTIAMERNPAHQPLLLLQQQIKFLGICM